jgi:alkylhydroperoxidase family enzyme
MTPLALAFLMTVPCAAPPSGDPPETSKPVGLTRDEEKALLEKHKQAKPRLPMPPADPDNPLARVNNGAFRAYYLPAELRETRGTGPAGRDADPAMTLDNTFKVKLFWIASRANNCYYCLGHQEYKLLGAGVSDDDIAALDGDWLAATSKERAAYAFTKKLTHTPHLVTAADVEALKKHYTATQVAEILVTVAGYNSTNRWTDGLNIPAEADGARFKKDGIKADFSTFKTPTSDTFAKQTTAVAPVKLVARPPLEARDKVEAIWKEKRTPTLPLADAKAVAEVWTDGPAPNWAALLATFPKSMKGRVAGLKAGTEKGDLAPKLKAQIAWVAARNDRAWYALAVARDRLTKAGVSDDDIWKLDGDRKHLSEAEQSALALAETLTVAPWKVTDEMVERCRKSFKDGEVAEVFYHACNAAFFDRVTETARLPFDK